MAEESMNQVIYKFLENSHDSKKDITDPLVRKEILDTIQAENPTWSRPSMDSGFSNQKNKFIKKRGLNPVELKAAKTKPKYDENMNFKKQPTTDEGGTKLKSTHPDTLKTEGEKKDGDKSKKLEVKTVSPISEEGFGGFASLLYSAFALTDQDMESELSDREKKDLGAVLKPLGDEFFSGTKSTAIIGTGTIAAFFINKKRAAMKKRKAKEEIKDNKLQTHTELRKVPKEKEKEKVKKIDQSLSIEGDNSQFEEFQDE